MSYLLLDERGRTSCDYEREISLVNFILFSQDMESDVDAHKVELTKLQKVAKSFTEEISLGRSQVHKYLLMSEWYLRMG